MRIESEVPEAASADPSASETKRSWQRPKIIMTDASEARADMGQNNADAVGFS
jgi:hypothetical protein